MEKLKAINSFKENAISLSQDLMDSDETKTENGRATNVSMPDQEKKSKLGAFFEWTVKIGLYVLAFLMPLFFLPFTIEPLEFNKQYLLFVFSFVLLIFWLARVLAQRKLEIKKSLLNILIILFLLSALISSLASKSIYQTILGFGGLASENLITFVCLAIIYFLASNSFTNKKDINILIFTIIGSALLAGIFGFLRLLGVTIFRWDFVKTSGFNSVGSVNSLEIFLAAVLVLAVAVFIEKKRPLWQQIVLGSATVIFLLLTLLFNLNFLNVWWSLLATAFLIICFGIFKQKEASQTRMILPMIIFAMALLLILTRINFAGKLVDLPTEVLPSWSSTLLVDKGAISNHLFFGSGPSTFVSNWDLYHPDDEKLWNIRFFSGISKVSSLPATLGAVGSFIFVLLIIFFAVWGALRLILKKGEYWFLAFGFFSAWLFLAIMQFLYPTNLTLEFLFWLALGVSLMLLRELKGKKIEKPGLVSLVFRRESLMTSFFSFLLVVFLVTTFSFLYLGATYWWADVQFARGVRAVQSGDLDRGLNLINRAIGLNPYRDNYLLSFSQVALLRVQQKLSEPKQPERDQIIQKLVADALNAAKKATDLNPKNPDNWLQRGIAYRTVLGYLDGVDQLMKDAFSEMIRLQPKNPDAYFQLGLSNVSLAQFIASTAGEDKDKQAKAFDYLNQAEEQFNKAVAIKSDYAPALY